MDLNKKKKNFKLITTVYYCIYSIGEKIAGGQKNIKILTYLLGSLALKILWLGIIVYQGCFHIVSNNITKNTTYNVHSILTISYMQYYI